MIESRQANQRANSNVDATADGLNIVSSHNEKAHFSTAPVQDDCTSPPSLSSSANYRSYPSPWSFFDNDVDLQEPFVGMEGIEGTGGIEAIEAIMQPAATLTAHHEPSQNKMMDWPTPLWSCSMEASTRDVLVPIFPDNDPDLSSSLLASPGDTSSSSSSTLDTNGRTSSTSVDCSIEDESIKPGCACIAASVLQSLESPGAPIQDKSQPSSAAQRKLRRNLDTVISTNKAVLEILHRISGCTCSVPGNHLVIISAVLFMVLAWYEACLGACDRAYEQEVVKGRPKDPDGFEMDAGTVTQKDRLGTGTDDHAELVYIPPIQVGSLELGTEARRQVVAQIVLAELAKVAKLIGGLTERSGGVGAPLVGVGGCQELEGQLQFSLRAALQTRIKTISQAAEKASK